MPMMVVRNYKSIRNDNFNGAGIMHTQLRINGNFSNGFSSFPWSFEECNT